jgi:biopolymer transport protein ExbD
MAGSVSSDFGDDEGGVMSDINVTPLVDVVLVLLIVFMITMPTIIGATPIKVDLPGTTQLADVPNLEKLPLDLYLKRGKDGKLALYKGADPNPTNEQALRDLVAAQGKPEDQPVSLSADKDIAYGEVVTVMDMLAGLKLHKLSLNTKHVSK